VGPTKTTGAKKMNASTNTIARPTIYPRLMPESKVWVGFTPTHENGLAILVGLDGKVRTVVSLQVVGQKDKKR